MSNNNYDNGFRAAQRAYDNQSPPEEYIIECDKRDEGVNDLGEVCINCAGDGSISISKAEFEKLFKDIEDETSPNTEV